ARSPAQIAPSGGLFVQQPAGVYYIFGGNGTQSGGGFYYLNYITHEFDLIAPTIQPNGSFSGLSPITNRSINGQISATSITLTYNGATVSSPKLPTYGPTKALSGSYLGSWVDNSGNVGVATLVIFPTGLAVVVAFDSFGANAGVGAIGPFGNFSINYLSGEV